MRKLRAPRVSVLIGVALFLLTGTALLQATATPTINPLACAYDVDGRRLVIKGDNFQSGAVVSLSNAAGPIAYGRVKVKGVKKIIVAGVDLEDVRGGVDVKIIINGVSSALVH